MNMLFIGRSTFNESVQGSKGPRGRVKSEKTKNSRNRASAFHPASVFDKALDKAHDKDCDQVLEIFFGSFIVLFV